MKELELEDDLLSKLPIRYVNWLPICQKPQLDNLRNLRATLYKESYEFVRQQRIQCLLQGAWFVNAIPVGSPREATRRPSRPWRFMRLVSQ
jgi:engulfment/cell motility protein 1